MNSIAPDLQISTAGRTIPRDEPSRPVRALGNVLVIASAVSLLVAFIVLWTFGGWDYYRAPLGTRGYLPAHRVLRPSGTVGLALGIAGTICMLGTLPYVLRKRWRALSKFGPTRHWLEVHIFFGIVGPILITFHTSFKFNGIVSVAFWLMAIVWMSGFVGRYLYVRIPRSIRGVELTHDDLNRQLTDIRQWLTEAGLPERAQRELDAFESAITPRTSRSSILDVLLGDVRVRARLLTLRRRLRGAAVDDDLIQAAVSLTSERAAILRRIAYLERTKRLFHLWHVLHRPLVFVMFLIVALHIGIALYLGYARIGS